MRRKSGCSSWSLLVERRSLLEIDPRLLGLLAVALLLRALLEHAREVVHLDQVEPARLLPQELGELEHALGLGVPDRLGGEEAAEQADRLEALVVARFSVDASRSLSSFESTGASGAGGRLRM